ncbi:hypothetical protein [Pelagicoccus sp. SDUM812002]|uniref:hypothetical protein n=1 Tax=Pelagicoccus sp. SDUM812002 TaxID=3041266 RepID=UPI00280CF9EC|nr:hypothetical protein [Pelagicoccus sp. SDUM812002]MDQ8185496.1 hypothetical protein [Pelagicoccus sp. SDUM812002]
MKKLASFLISLALAANLFAQEHPKSSSPFTRSLTDSYLALQAGLASDDLNTAREAALAYIAAFDISTASLNTEALTLHANEIASAADLHTARYAFRELSEQAKMLFDYLATPDSEPLYLIHCSMAFAGEGADWIQASPNISNPYYGARMFTCGSVTRSLGSAASAVPDAHSDSCCTSGVDPSECESHAAGACCQK